MSHNLSGHIGKIWVRSALPLHRPAQVPVDEGRPRSQGRHRHPDFAFVDMTQKDMTFQEAHHKKEVQKRAPSRPTGRELGMVHPGGYWIGCSVAACIGMAYIPMAHVALVLGLWGWVVGRHHFERSIPISLDATRRWSIMQPSNAGFHLASIHAASHVHIVPRVPGLKKRAF